MCDLDAYFTRIAYAGPRSAGLAVLRAIHALHPAAIPFENLDPLLGRPVPLGLDALQAKMVGHRRGGYCFEHNTLFRAVLETLGFRVTTLVARVLWMRAPDAPLPPRSHMLLGIDLAEGPYIADVGFGGNLVAAPLALTPDAAQQTPGGVLRLRQEAGLFTLQRGEQAGWRDVYCFTLEPQVPADIEAANWFTSTHPQSRFRNNLVVQLLTPLCRTALLNRRLVHRHVDGRTDEAWLDGPADLARALSQEFALDCPADPADVFARLPQD